MSNTLYLNEVAEAQQKFIQEGGSILLFVSPAVQEHGPAALFLTDATGCFTIPNIRGRCRGLQRIAPLPPI